MDKKMNQKGLTLIELVVVIAIIAIGAALLSPNITGWMPVYRLKSATRNVVSAMRVAQIKAVSSNIWYRVSFDPGQGKYFIENSQDLGANWTKEGDDQALPTGVQFNTNLQDHIVTFFPNSTAMQGSVPSVLMRGRITVVNSKGTTKTIELWGTTGRIKHG